MRYGRDIRRRHQQAEKDKREKSETDKQEKCENATM